MAKHLRISLHRRYKPLMYCNGGSPLAGLISGYRFHRGCLLSSYLPVTLGSEPYSKMTM